MSIQRLEAFFSGRVQGVGFRFTAERFAEELSLRGYVKNLMDGRVELVAEGEEKDLESLLQRIRKGFLSQYIEGVEVSWLSPKNDFLDFRIAYYL